MEMAMAMAEKKKKKCDCGGECAPIRLPQYWLLPPYYPCEKHEQLLQEEEEEEEEEEEDPMIMNGIKINDYFEVKQYPVMLFEKELECCELACCPNRLLITGSGRDTLLMALTQQERAKVMNRDDFLEVITSDNIYMVYPMRLMMKSEGAVALTRCWSNFVSLHRLKIGDIVQGWGYRLGHAPAEFRLELSFIRRKP